MYYINKKYKYKSRRAENFRAAALLVYRLIVGQCSF